MNPAVTSRTSRKSTLTRRQFLDVGIRSSAAALLAGCTDEAPIPWIGDITDGYIDAHVHIWTDDPEHYPLGPNVRRGQLTPTTFTAEKVLNVARRAGVSRIVLVHISYFGYDNSYMLDMMRKYKGVFAGIGRIDTADRPRQRMLELARQGVRGFRVVVPGENESTRWLNEENIATMWACGADEGLAMCLLMHPGQLLLVDKMCQKYPRTPVVIDHFARVGRGEIRAVDLDHLCGLARHKNVTVKASAFHALGNKRAPYLDLGPLVRRVVDAFGPDRVMWGSDCPFQLQRGHTYNGSIELIKDRLDFLTESDRDWILRKTAEKVFFL